MSARSQVNLGWVPPRHISLRGGPGIGVDREGKSLPSTIPQAKEAKRWPSDIEHRIDVPESPGRQCEGKNAAAELMASRGKPWGCSLECRRIDQLVLKDPGDRPSPRWNEAAPTSYNRLGTSLIQARHALEHLHRGGVHVDLPGEPIAGISGELVEQGG